MADVTATGDNQTWTVINPGTFTIHALGGINTLNLGTSLRSSYTITESTDGAIHVDSVSSASGALHATLFNVEVLVFNSGRDKLDLVAMFGSNKGPAVTGFSPAADAMGVPLNSDIVLTFGVPVTAGTGVINVLNSDGSTAASYDVSSNNVSVSRSTLTIHSASNLNINSTYHLSVPSGAVKDMSGNSYAGSSSYTFTTQAGATPTIVGSATNANLVGTAGNDVFSGLSGNGTIAGGGGLDTAIFSGKKANFTISGAGADFTVQDNTGAHNLETLHQVMRLQFADAFVALDINGTAGQAYRLYQAAFNRTPDQSGLGYWIGQMDKGAESLKHVAAGFLLSAEFQKLYGANVSDDAFITALYSNVLHRAPDQAGFNYWHGQISNGFGRDSILASFSESAENQAQVIGQIKNGISYIPFS